MEAKYDRIGDNYNQTRKPDPYLISRLLHHLAPRKEAICLDIGCGTGNYTNAIAQKGIKFIGIDPSEKMLKVAKIRNPKIDWRKGTAENTGLEDESVAAIMGTLTIHHWKSLKEAFKELYRVLKPGGRMVIFTSTPQQMRGYWLNEYFPKMLKASIRQMPALDLVTKTMTEAGFIMETLEPYHIHPRLEDKFLYCGKQNPQLYLDPIIRKGISSFSDLANQEEIQAGLVQLKADIINKRILDIMKTYENPFGDYLYLVAKKN